MHSSLSRSIASLAVSATFFGLGSMPAAQAGVVLGNLGADGSTGALSTTNTGITADVKVAQVFTTPASNPDLELSSITLGAFTSVTPAPLFLEVWTGNSTAPGSLFATSTNTQTLTADTNGALFTWNFANVPMLPSTTYWIRPPTGLNWNFRGFSSPVAQNSSGYVYVGGYESVNGGSTWGTDGPAPYAVSVQAVPEPSTYCMALAGLACGGFSMWRRRRRA